MISLNDVLLAASNIPVDDPIAEIWGRGLQSGYKIIEYTGALPITITANGAALLDYRIYGASGGVGEEVDITGLSEPLCGIQTYTDTLDLSTGILTRRIKKLVLTGEEDISFTPASSSAFRNVFRFHGRILEPYINIAVGTHFNYSVEWSGLPYRMPNNSFSLRAYDMLSWYFSVASNDFNSLEEFVTYLKGQYAEGTPFTIWYVLAKPVASTISIPSGLTGTIEGYLIQDGTPTPEAPIYPTANGVKQADGTYSIEYGYKLPMVTSDGTTDIDTPVYIGDTPLGEDEYVDYGEQKIYKRTENLFDKNAAIDGYEILGSKISRNTNWYISDFIPVQPNVRYKANAIADAMLCYKSKDDSAPVRRNGITTSNGFLVPNDYNFIIVNALKTVSKDIVMLTELSKFPAEYIPYVAPTTPPVSLPEIPTIDGTTVIDCELETKPDEMYVKYIQGGEIT